MLLGVDEASGFQVVGVEDPATIERELGALLEQMEPPIRAPVTTVWIDGLALAGLLSFGDYPRHAILQLNITLVRYPTTEAGAPTLPATSGDPILDALRAGARSRRQIEAVTGLPRNVVIHRLRQLRDVGLAEMIGSTKSAQWRPAGGTDAESRL